MASKVKVTRLLEELRGYAEITNRRPLSPQGVAPLWMSIRPQVLPATLPKRRVEVASPAANAAAGPAPVKIAFTPPMPGPGR